MVKIMEIPIKMDDLGVPLFLETPIIIANLDFWCNKIGMYPSRIEWDRIPTDPGPSI